MPSEYMQGINKNPAYNQENFQKDRFCSVSTCNFPAVLSSISVHKLPFSTYDRTTTVTIHPKTVWILLRSDSRLLFQAADNVKVSSCKHLFPSL